MLPELPIGAAHFIEYQRFTRAVPEIGGRAERVSRTIVLQQPLKSVAANDTAG